MYNNNINNRKRDINMVEISKEILEKYGIYKTRKVEETEKEKLLKIKKEIEKIIEIPIERLYLINESAWGKEAKNAQYSICVLVDKRYKDLDEKRELLVEYCEKKKIVIYFWSLCQFEKRKDTPTEHDYYIDKYGIKIYDSGKETEINEKVETTEYAANMGYYRMMRTYIQGGNPDYLMADLVRIYTLKIGYATIGKKGELNRDCDFAKMISKDERAIEIIDRYLLQTDEREKNKILEEFEKYLKTVRQVKFPMKIKYKPTMNVYEKLLKVKEKNGTLDIKTLTKEDLYIMYIIQGVDTFKIADLYGVDNKKISGKRNNWNIRLIERAFIDDKNIINRAMESIGEENEKYAYAFFKRTGIMNFEKCILPILEYMADDNVYLLKEFWKFTEGEKGKIEKYILKDSKDSYYRASMCMDLLVQNDLVEEVDFKQYRINKNGKELLGYCYRNNINELNIPIMSEILGSVEYYGLYYEEGYPTEIDNEILNEVNENVQMDSNEDFEGSLVVEEKEDYFEEIDDPELARMRIEEQAANLQEIEYECKTGEKIKNRKNRKEKPVKVDFGRINEVKSKFGRKCEEIIYQHEVDMLKAVGRRDLADKVIWVSKEIGDWRWCWI